jgi:AmmeMemoRadiSam system protein B
MNHYRKPAVAGMFYPANPISLREEVKTLMASAKLELKPEKIFGLVSPHAGYIYSGRTAAFGFNLLKGSGVKNVIIISPSHREYFPGISIYEGEGYETPLGVVPVNEEMREKLISDSRIIYKGLDGHRQEHAIEVQLPFLQLSLSNFQIVPVVMGDQGKMFVDELAAAIAKSADDSTVVVASSDLSHYYSQQIADRLDSVVARRVEEFDIEGLQSDLDEKRCEACGGGPIVAMLKAASLLNKKKTVVLYRTTSGETSGNYDEVVGYLSAVVYGE